MQLGHLLTSSGLTYTEVSSNVRHNFFCQMVNSVSLPWVIYYEALVLPCVWKEWHWVRIFSKYRGFSLSVSFQQCSILTHSIFYPPTLHSFNQLTESLSNTFINNFYSLHINTKLHTHTEFKMKPNVGHPFVSSSHPAPSKWRKTEKRRQKILVLRNNTRKITYLFLFKFPYQLSPSWAHLMIVTKTYHVISLWAESKISVCWI